MAGPVDKAFDRGASKMSKVHETANCTLNVQLSDGHASHDNCKIYKVIRDRYLIRSIREPSGPWTKYMEVSESRMERDRV